MSLHRFLEVRKDGTYHAMPLSLAQPGTRFTPIMDFVLRPSALAVMKGLVPGHDVTTPPAGDTTTV